MPEMKIAAGGNLPSGTRDKPIMQKRPLGKIALSLLALSFALAGHWACLGGGATGGVNPMDGIGGANRNGAVGGAADLGDVFGEDIAPEDNTTFTYRDGAFEVKGGVGPNAAAPLDPGYPDPHKVLSDKKKVRYLQIESIQAVCKYPATKRVKLEVKGSFWVKDGNTRILRIVDPKDKQFVNTEAPGGAAHNVSFQITTAAIEPLRIYLMPKDYVPVYLNEERPCANGRCSPDNKKAIFAMTPEDVNVDDIEAPECGVPQVMPEAEYEAGD